jgi:Uma2 family endonuclease
MSDFILPETVSFLEGIDPSRILARDVSEAEYLKRYAEHHAEWVEGFVIRMAPVTEDHDESTLYIVNLFQVYLELHPIAVMRREPFVMRAQADRQRFREPDLLLVLNEHLDRLTRTALLGAADLCVEIVSEGSVNTDYVVKFEEYERAGVQEYWIIDTMRRVALFYRLGEDGRYILQDIDAFGDYTTPMLPKLRIHVQTLWQSPPPGIFAVMDAVKAMVAAD